MEEKIYERQVTKLSLAGRVVDEHQISRHYNMDDLMALFRFTPSTGPRETPRVPKVFHSIPTGGTAGKLLPSNTRNIGQFLKNSCLEKSGNLFNTLGNVISFFLEMTFHTLPHLKCIRLVSVRSSLPGTDTGVRIEQTFFFTILG